VLQTLLPLLLIWWVFAPGRSGRLELLAKSLLVFNYLIAITVAGVWVVPSIYAPYAYFALFAIYVVIAWYVKRDRPWYPQTRAARNRVIAYGVIAALLAVFTAVAGYGARSVDETPVALDFPLREGTFYVVNGGGNDILNMHMAAADPKHAAFRGQSRALDIVAVDRWGQRSDGLLPDNPEAYVVFGKPVVAPCDGVVKLAVDGLPDLAPPKADPTHLAGNHVMLTCGSVEVLLAHLQNGSVAVKPGDVVKRGDPLGRVGNSGNTSEPHLHVHAQRGGPEDTLLDRDPLPMSFGGRVLARGDRVVN
jgi:hypothetical protein